MTDIVQDENSFELELIRCLKCGCTVEQSDSGNHAKWHENLKDILISLVSSESSRGLIPRIIEL